jgi:hypothetical protein
VCGARRVPIHTFEGEKYKNIFNESIVELKDEEIIGI